MNSYLLKESNI